MIPPDLGEVIEKAAQLVLESSYCVAFTGAGMSVESGVPPFRGEGGIWNSYDPSVLELSYFLVHPDRSWTALKELFYGPLAAAQPNPGHLVLADLEQQGLLNLVITQNIDDLHYKAGSKNLIEYHGTYRRLVCLSCGGIYEASGVDLERLPPRCSCAGVLKPDLVFFGENIPGKALVEAEKAARRADCLLLIGASGEVYPAAALPHTASRAGARIIEINPNPTPYTETVTNLHLPLPASKALTALAEQVARLKGA